MHLMASCHILDLLTFKAVHIRQYNCLLCLLVGSNNKFIVANVLYKIHF